MKAGPGRGKATPIEIREVMGNPSKYPIPKQLEKQPVVDLRECPENLQNLPDAVEAWNKTLPQLIHMEVLAESDLPAFESYCMNVAVRNVLWRKINEGGYSVQGPQGVKKNPDVTCWENANAAILRFSSEFGLTPVARTRIAIKRADKKVDSLSAFLGTAN